LEKQIMKTFIGIHAGGALAAICISCSSLAITNSGFETGTLAGWTASVPPGGSAGVVTSHVSAGIGSTYTPVEGSYFALLKSDGPGSFTTLSQAVTLSAGDMVKGFAAFDYGDYHPFNDSAEVRILDMLGAPVATPWKVAGLDVANYADGPWGSWAWTALSGGSYTIELRVTNGGDAGYDSYGLFDAFLVPEQVPESGSTLALMLGAAALIGGLRRKFQSTL
jgi:hypothetical protein